MKGLESWMDLLSIGVGMIGAMLKGIKRRLRIGTIVLSMTIAGILTYSVTGLVAYFYADLNPKVIVLISFCIGWVANEITDKMDEFIGDSYDIFIDWLKQKYGNKK
jgi:CHASE2 domain-containing sensor protein